MHAGRAVKWGGCPLMERHVDGCAGHVQHPVILVPVSMVDVLSVSMCRRLCSMLWVQAYVCSGVSVPDRNAQVALRAGDWDLAQWVWWAELILQSQCLTGALYRKCPDDKDAKHLQPRDRQMCSPNSTVTCSQSLSLPRLFLCMWGVSLSLQFHHFGHQVTSWYQRAGFGDCSPLP